MDLFNEAIENLPDINAAFRWANPVCTFFLGTANQFRKL